MFSREKVPSDGIIVEMPLAIAGAWQEEGKGTGLGARYSGVGAARTPRSSKGVQEPWRGAADLARGTGLLADGDGHHAEAHGRAGADGRAARRTGARGVPAVEARVRRAVEVGKAPGQLRHGRLEERNGARLQRVGHERRLRVNDVVQVLPRAVRGGVARQVVRVLDGERDALDVRLVDARGEVGIGLRRVLEGELL